MLKVTALNRPCCALCLAILLLPNFIGGAAAQSTPPGGELTTAGSLLQPDPQATEASGLSDAPAVETAPTAARTAALKRLELRSGSTEPITLATWDNGTFTSQDLSSTLALRRPASAGNFSAADLLAGQKERLANVVRDLVYELVLYRKATGEGAGAKAPEIATRLDYHRDLLLFQRMYERHAMPLLLTAERKDARAYYEENKERLYTVPGGLSIRAFKIPKHLPYETREGDTLTSIAANISGNPASASRILRGKDVPYFRASQSPGVPTVALKPGEQLLVPMDADGLTSAARVAREFREALTSGQSPDQLLNEYPQIEAALNNTPYTPDPEGMLPEVVKFIYDDNSTTVSEVFDTPWGYTVVQIADRQTTRVLSYEEAEERIYSAIGKDRARQLKHMDDVRRALYEKFAPKYGLKLHEETLKRKDYGGADPLTGSTPIISGDDFTFTLDQFLADMRPVDKTWASTSFEERVNDAKSSPEVLKFLFRKEAEATGVDRLPDFKREMESKAIIEVTRAYLEKQREQLTNPSDEELRQYYQKHIDKYTSEPRVTLREISKRVNLNAPDEVKERNIENKKKELAALKEKLKSQADFEQAARRESEAISTRSRGGLVGTVPAGFRGAAFANQIAQLQPGQISDPFLYGAEVMIIHLDSREPANVVPFEDAFPRVKRDYSIEVPGKAMDAQREKTLKEAGFQLKL